MGRAFKGGIILSGKPAKNLVSETADPSKVKLAIPQDYKINTQKGASVKRGDILAYLDGTCLPVVSSISGVVESVGNGFVCITSDGQNTLSEKCHPLEKNLQDYSPDRLRRELLWRGVEIPAAPVPVKQLIINCVENDSFVSSGSRLILEQAQEIMTGVKILMYIYGVKKSICAVSSSMLKCADQLDAYAPRSMVKVKLVSRKFPQQEPHMLVSTLFNLEINTTVNTEDVGYVTVSPEICAAVYHALAEGEPYTSRIVTVAGDCTGYICNLGIPFGTSVKEVLEKCGGILVQPEVVLCGGEMSGKALEMTDVIDADTVALTAFSKNQLPEPDESLPCINCGKCAAVCPSKILPSFIYRCADKGMVQSCLDLDIECCINCGCCTAVCPSGIDLAESIARAQETIEQICIKDSERADDEPEDEDNWNTVTREDVVLSDVGQVIENLRQNNEDTQEDGTSTEEDVEKISEQKDMEMPGTVTDEVDASCYEEPVLLDEQIKNPNAYIDEDEVTLKLSVNGKRSPSRRLSAALRSTETVATVCIDYMVALIPLLAWSVYLFGFRTVTIAAISMLSCLLFDAGAQYVIDKSVTLRDTTVLVAGMMIALGLPPTAPLWLPVLAAVIVVGLRRLCRLTNAVTFDPVVTTLTLFTFILPKIMTAFCAVGSKLPVFAMSVGHYTAAPQSMIDAMAGGTLPNESLGSVFVGMRAGLIGEMSALIIILSGIYLASRKIIRVGMPLSFAATVFIVANIFPNVPIISDLIALQFAAYELLAGDLLLGIVILAASPYIAPMSSRAGIVLGIIGGGITIALRLIAPSLPAVLIALLIMSVLSRPFDRWLRPSVFGGKVKNGKSV